MDHPKPKLTTKVDLCAAVIFYSFGQDRWSCPQQRSLWPTVTQGAAGQLAANIAAAVLLGSSNDEGPLKPEYSMLEDQAHVFGMSNMDV
eukprot:gene13194-19027_t